MYHWPLALLIHFIFSLSDYIDVENIILQNKTISAEVVPIYSRWDLMFIIEY